MNTVLYKYDMQYLEHVYINMLFIVSLKGRCKLEPCIISGNPKAGVSKKEN